MAEYFPEIVAVLKSNPPEVRNVKVELYENEKRVASKIVDITTGLRYVYLSYAPETGTEKKIDYWRIKVFTNSELQDESIVYTPKIWDVTTMIYPFPPHKAVIYVKFNDYSKLRESAFFLGITIKHDNSYADFHPLLIKLYNNSIKIQDVITGEYCTESREADYKRFNINIYDDKAELVCGAYNPNLIIYEGDLGGLDKIYVALWHAYDGTYMRGLIDYWVEEF